METAIISAISSIVLSIITFLGTKYKADKEKENIIERNKSEIERLEKDHRHELERLNIDHEQKIAMKDKDLQIEMERNQQSEIDDFSRDFMQGIIGDLISGNGDKAQEKFEGLDKFSKSVQQQQAKQYARNKKKG